MPLEGAYLYTDQHLSGKPYAVLSDGPDNGNGGIPYALVYFGDAHLRVHSADVARAFIVAFAEAAGMLEPEREQDAVKQVRELLPKTTLHEPAPFTSPDLVTPPAVSAAEAAGLLLPRCTSRRCVLRAGHDGVHEDADGNEAAEADLAPCAADDEPWCGANTRTEDGPFGCTAVAGHEGSHVAYGPQDQVCHTWPQAAKASTL
jgi:hypothetical protein